MASINPFTPANGALQMLLESVVCMAELRAAQQLRWQVGNKSPMGEPSDNRAMFHGDLCDVLDAIQHGLGTRLHVALYPEPPLGASTPYTTVTEPLRLATGMAAL